MTLLSTSFGNFHSKKLEDLALQLVREILPDQRLDIVPASFGKRIIIGDPVEIHSTHWSPRFLHSTGLKDITGNKGYLVFYSGNNLNWQGSKDDIVKLDSYLQITSVGRERDAYDLKGFFFKILEKIPTWARQHNLSFVMQDVINDKLLKYFMANTDSWTATKCSTNQGEHDWSFYHKPTI